MQEHTIKDLWLFSIALKGGRWALQTNVNGSYNAVGAPGGQKALYRAEASCKTLLRHDAVALTDRLNTLVNPSRGVCGGSPACPDESPSRPQPQAEKRRLLPTASRGLATVTSLLPQGVSAGGRPDRCLCSPNRPSTPCSSAVDLWSRKLSSSPCLKFPPQAREGES